MDTNPVSVASEFLKLVKSDFAEHSIDEAPTDGEKQLANELLKYFYTLLTEFTFTEETILDSPTDSQTSSYSQMLLVDDAGQTIKEENSDTVPIERKAEILKFIATHPNWSLTTLQNRGCKEFKHLRYKKRWEEQLTRGGTIFEKYTYIDKYVFEKFEEARQDFKVVKDRDLQLWGLQAGQTFRDLTFTFKAGHTWLNDFKRRHGISSRKVTKLVGRREIMSLEAIKEAASKFQMEFRQFTSSFQSSQILNTDQVGFVYEMTGNRTLSFTGEKDTLGVAKSPTNLATHSYTAQYLISMSGEIIGDVFLCLQERTGRLGPRIQDELFPAANVTVTCSASGKLTTSLYEYFLDKVVVKNVNEDFLLMIDQWPGQTNCTSYAERFGINGIPNCTVKFIPKKCTSICQPLDTTFHRQLKYFARRIYLEASLKYSSDINPADEVTTRNNIVRLQSLLRNQLGASVFKPMIRYSWYSSGLTDDRPLFFTVKDVCFTFNNTDSPYCECKNPRFLKCAHCRQQLCFVCFYYNYHFHQ